MEQTENCLIVAVDRGLVQFVQLLLEAGAEVNISNENHQSPIHVSLKNGQHEMLDLLLRFGADVNTKDGKGRTVLHNVINDWYSWTGEDESINREANETHWPYFERLIQHPAMDVNVQDENGDTPLDLAVHKGLKNVAEKLLQKGAEINQPVVEILAV